MGSLTLARLNKHKRSKAIIVFLLVCVLPTFVLYAILKLVPLGMMIMQSFQSFTSIFGEKVWTGFSNYQTIFAQEQFWYTLGLTAFYIIVATIITIIFALMLATMLSKSKAKGKTFFRIVFYIPNILSVVIIGGIFSGLFSLNGIINALFGTKIAFFASRGWAKWCILFGMIWQAVGYYMVMYIAGMDSIPDSLYESARLDGASSLRQFFQITIPMLWEVIRTTLTFFIISNLNLAFLFVLTFIGGEEINIADTTLNYMQRLFNNSQYGSAMAVGTFLFVLTFVASLIVQRVTKREVIEAQ